MPELPEVEVLRRQLELSVFQQKISSVDILDGKIVKTPHDELLDALIRNQFVKTDRIGKYLFLETERGTHLMLHFGLTGRAYYVSPTDDLPKYTRVIIYFENAYRFCIASLRKFGKMQLVDDIKAYQEEIKLADDALLANQELMAKKIMKSSRLIKSILLDQKIAAGIGNWIADEILYQAKVHPEKRGTDLKEGEVKLMLEKMIHILEIAIELQSDFEHFPDYFLVKYRGEEALCYHTGKPIIRTEVGGRGTYYSPSWQILNT